MMVNNIMSADVQVDGLVEIVCSAISDKRVLEIFHSGHRSLVEPHAVGVNDDGRVVMLVFEVERDNKWARSWRVIHLDDVLFTTVVERKSEAPRIDDDKPDVSTMRVFEGVF